MVYRPEDAGSVKSLVTGLLAITFGLWRIFLAGYEIRRMGIMKEDQCQSHHTALSLTMMT
ncbi:MAG TPA: hypothetical protein VN227_05835 [Methanoregula sp.]|nr:hypothetical protein [Methanoregula sp.]